MSIGIRPVFEQWALEQGWDIGRADDNSYRTQTTDAAWGGWVAANAPAPNTSPALERVIAEQQREIDTIRKYREIDADRWIKHNAALDKLAQAAIGALDSQSPEDHFHLRRTLIAMGPGHECDWRVPKRDECHPRTTQSDTYGGANVMTHQCKSCGGFCGKSGCERLNTNHPDYDKTEWNVRGLLAESLKCWCRLTGEEAAELVAFVQAAQAAQPAPRRLTEAEITLLVEAYYEDFGSAPPDLIRQVEGLIFGDAQPAQVPAQVPVLYQYRWTNPAGENQPASRLEWKPVEPAWGQTVEQKCNELRGYRYKGVPTYEVRGLYAAPSTKEGV